MNYVWAENYYQGTVRKLVGQFEDTFEVSLPSFGALRRLGPSVMNLRELGEPYFALLGRQTGSNITSDQLQPELCGLLQADL